MIRINGLKHLIDALARLDIVETQRSALSEEAGNLAAVVKSTLHHRAGEDHATPWLRTGKLHDSIAVTTGDDWAVVGSSDEVAVYQELGSRSIPPRPFLGPVGAMEAEHSARRLGHVIANDVRKAVR